MALQSVQFRNPFSWNPCNNDNSAGKNRNGLNEVEILKDFGYVEIPCANRITFSGYAVTLLMALGVMTIFGVFVVNLTQGGFGVAFARTGSQIGAVATGVKEFCCGVIRQFLYLLLEK